MSDWMWDLSRLDAGDLSVLRRAAGTDFRQASVSAQRAFYKACGYCEEWQEKFMFPAVCMDALWRSTDRPTVKPMQECLKDMKAKEQETTESIQHRIDSLLETTWDEGGFLIGKLLNIVKILKSKTDLKPNFFDLAKDLSQWNHPEHYIQRKWLKTLYNMKNENKDEEE